MTFEIYDHRHGIIADNSLHSKEDINKKTINYYMKTGDFYVYCCRYDDPKTIHAIT